jgi:hypothetical protein
VQIRAANSALARKGEKIVAAKTIQLNNFFILVYALVVRVFVRIMNGLQKKGTSQFFS